MFDVKFMCAVLIELLVSQWYDLRLAMRETRDTVSLRTLSWIIGGRLLDRRRFETGDGPGPG